MKEINKQPFDNITTIFNIELDNSLEMYETLLDDLWRELWRELWIE